MIDITKQRKVEAAPQTQKTTVAPTPTLAPATRTVAQPAPAPVAPATGPLGENAMQAIEKIHGPGGARDPFAAEAAQAAADEAAMLAQRKGERGQEPPVLRPAEVAPVEGSPEQTQAAIDQAQNIQRVPVTPEQQQQLTDIAVQESAAIVADRRATLLTDAGLDERGLSALVALNPNKTEEEILAISLANNERFKKSYINDLATTVGGHLQVAKRQLLEAASGHGEGVAGGQMEPNVPVLGGLERTAKVLQAIAMTPLAVGFTLQSYATGEIAQTEIMVSPLASRFAQNMAAAGLNINSPDSPNARLEIVSQTLIDGYLHGSSEEANWAAPILVQRGYLEALAGGVTPGVVGLVKAPFKLTGTGLALIRNAARTAKRAQFQKVAADALAASGGLERRMGPQGSVSGRLSRIAASAPADSDVARIGTLANRIAVREAATTAALEVRTAPRGTVMEVPYAAQNRLIPEEMARTGVPQAAFSISLGAIDKNTMTGGKMAGFFDPDKVEIRLDPAAFAKGAAPRREAVAAFIHEVTHFGDFLAKKANSEKFLANDDIERLPTKIQATVLKLLGAEDATSLDPVVRVLFRQQGLRGQLAEAAKKFAADERSAGGIADEAPYTSLRQYADKSLEARTQARLNEMRYKRSHGVGAQLTSEELKAGKTPGGPPSAEERALADKLLKIRAENAARPENAYDFGGAAPRSLGGAIANREKTIGASEVAGAPAAVAEKAPSTPGQHADVIHKMTVDGGGATYNLKKGDLSGEDAWSVGAYPERAVTIKGRDVTPGEIENFIKDNETLLKRGDISVGTWKDPETGNTILDLVKTPSVEQFLKVTSGENSLKNARILARKQAIEIAKESGQGAIYNLRTGRTVQTPKALPNALDVSGIIERVRAHGTPELFAKASKWYTNAQEFARAMSNEADFAPTSLSIRHVSAAMAALSAQNEWAGAGKMDNLKAIFKLVRAYERGDPDPFAIEEGMNLSGAQVQKAWRALNSKGDPLDELVGAKERSFALNILGEGDMATVDRHIVKGQYTTRAKAATGSPPSAAEHGIIQAGYEKALADMKAAGQVPADMNIKDLQAFDWGILGQKELDFWSQQADTMFPGTAPEDLPYTVSPGIGETQVVGAERPAMGGLASKAFEKYKSVGDVVRLIKTTGYNGIADFSKAVMEGDPKLVNAPYQLIEDFAYAHVERGAVGLWDKPEDIERIVKNYVKFIKEGKKTSVNDVITEEATGKPRDICSTCPTAASPSSTLSIKDGQGDPKLEVPDDSPYGFGGISGVGMDGHGIVGAPEPLLGITMAESGLTVKPSKAGPAENIAQGSEQGPLAGAKLMGHGTKAPIEGSVGKTYQEYVKKINDFERAMQATGDQSFIGNQGWISMWTHPVEAAHMVRDSMRAFGSREGLAKVNQSVNALPSHDLALRVGLPLDRGPVHGPDGQIMPGDSEFFQSAFANKFPLVERSARSYAGAGNSLRSRIFDTYANAWDLIKVDRLEFGSPEYIKKMKLAFDLKDYTSIITGIGDIRSLPKVLQDIGPAFFAYKFFMSKFNMLTAPLTYTTQAARGLLPSRIGPGKGIPTPLYLTPEHASSWQIAYLAWRDLSMYGAGVFLSASALKAAGVDVGLDPNQESKFLQITMGDGDSAFQFDMTGGLGKVYSLLHQTLPVVGSGVHTTRSGKTYKLAEAHKAPFQSDAVELWETFLKGKLGPAYAQSLEVARGTNYQGQPTTAWDLLPLPITAKNMIETFSFSDSWRKDPEAVAIAVGSTIMQFFGAHGFIKDTKMQPPGFLGQPIGNIFGGGPEQAPADEPY